METIWLKPVEHFMKKDKSLMLLEFNWEEAIGMICLVAVDECGNIVCGLRLKTIKPYRKIVSHNIHGMKIGYLPI